MSKMMKRIDDEHIEISDYIVHDAVELRETDFAPGRYIFKEVINPFSMYTENEMLKYELQQKENIIKEVREYIKNINNKKIIDLNWEIEELLEILDKEKE